MTFKRILLIARRDLAGYLLNPQGYIIIAVLLLLDGFAFNAIALTEEKRSSEVVQLFFFYSCGFVAAASILFSMRSFAEEKPTGPLVLLQTSPASEWEIVAGKFLGAYGFLVVFIAMTTFLPAMVFINGSPSWGHLVVGYGGLLLEGAALTALGVMTSAMSKNQLVAAVSSAGIVVALFLCWMVAKKIEGPLGDVIGYLDVFDSHYRSFSRGIFKLSSTIYFLTLTYVGLLGATLVLSARRWRA